MGSRVLLIVLVVGFAAVRAEELPALLTRWIAAEAGMGSVRVAFRQEVRNPALRDAVVSEGTLWRLKDSGFRWELGRPPQTILVRQGEALQWWEAESDQWKPLDAKDRRFRSWLPFLSGAGLRLDDLEREFEISQGTADARLQTLILVPKVGMARKYLKSIELRLDAASLRLKRLLVTQADGGSTLMSFDAPEPVAER